MFRTSFRALAVALIVFNLAGTLVTWLAHLSRPGTGASHAVLQGTEFTGPLAFVACWVVCAVALWHEGRAAVVGTWVMTIFALAFSIGEVSELTKSNVGVSPGRWDAILVLDVLGLALALSVVAAGALTIARRRRVAAAH